MKILMIIRLHEREAFLHAKARRQESLIQEDKNNDIDNNKSKSNATTTKLLGTKDEANDKIKRLCWWKER